MKHVTTIEDICTGAAARIHTDIDVSKVFKQSVLLTLTCGCQEWSVRKATSKKFETSQWKGQS